MVAAAVALCGALGGQTQGAISFGILFVVDSTGDQTDVAPGNGLCDIGDGHCTLRAALQEVDARNNGGDGISFNIPTSQPGCDATTGACTIYPTKALPNISDSVNINGPGADKVSVRNISGIKFRIFNVTATGTVTLSGLTIGGPSSDPFGGSAGGGIQNSNTGTVNISSCTIIGNVAANNPPNSTGGGIYNISGTVHVTNSTIDENSASVPGVGGGIYNDSGTVTVTNSRLTNNYSIGDCGGGIFNRAGTVNIVSSELSGNFAGPDSSGFSFGGGGVCNSGTVNVINSTLSGNGAFNTSAGHGGYGGGGVFSAGTMNVTNSTISGNAIYGTSDLGGGGGIFNQSPGVMNVKSSIIALNTSTTSGPDVFGTFASKGFNLIGKKDGSTGFTAATDKKGTVTSPLNPKLDPRGLRDNGGPTQTIALVKGSPAIDKGTSNGLTGTLTTDQRGFARTVDNSGIANATGGDGTDNGAYEFGAH